MPMKPRKQLSGSEVDELIQALAARLRTTAVETQPQVAGKLLELIREDSAGINEFAAVIKTDSALSGRLLRLANSAYFAQRDGVSTIERAAVLLGLQRIKAVSLGFYLARSVGDPAEELSRKTWGHSLYRACLASEIARLRKIPHRAEAFMIGMLLDSGIPLMYRLIGPAYEKALEAAKTPARLFQIETEALGFTHVDIASALMSIWNLPDMLRKPIERHHVRPEDDARRDASKADPVSELHRIAYYVGSVDLTATGAPAVSAPNQSTAKGVVNIDVVELKDAIATATDELRAVREMFAEIADTPSDLESLATSAHTQLVDTMDNAMIQQLDEEHLAVGEIIKIDNSSVSVRRADHGIVACRLDSHGRPLVSFEFTPGHQPLDEVLDALGVDCVDPNDVARLGDIVERLAA